MVDTKFQLIQTKLNKSPAPTKFQTPGRYLTSKTKRDPRKAKEILSRVVKRISIMKRLNIIRQVNEVIERVVEVNEDGETITFKKLIKIFNLIQIYIPLVQIKANNSTDFCLNI